MCLVGTPGSVRLNDEQMVWRRDIEIQGGTHGVRSKFSGNWEATN
jgi:hypothetical protein